MSTLFTLTVTDQTNDSKVAEVQLISQACMLAQQVVRSMKTATSGNIIVERGKNIGTWSYTGTASKEG